MPLELKRLKDCQLAIQSDGPDRYEAKFTDGDKTVYSIDVTYVQGQLTYSHEKIETTKLFNGHLVPDGRIEEEQQDERILAQIEKLRGIYRGTVENLKNSAIPVKVTLNQSISDLVSGALATIQSTTGQVVPTNASILTISDRKWHYRITGSYSGEPYNIEILDPVSNLDG